MKVVKWGLLGLGDGVAAAACYLFIGGKSPIQWSALSYTDAVAESSKSNKPVLIDFSSAL